MFKRVWRLESNMWPLKKSGVVKVVWEGVKVCEGGQAEGRKQQRLNWCGRIETLSL